MDSMTVLNTLVLRELKLKLRWKPFLLSQITTPLIYLFFIGIGFSAQMQSISYKDYSLRYLDFLIPGLLALQAFYTFGMLGSMVSNEQRYGIYKLFLLFGVKPPMYVISKLLTESAVLTIQSIAMIAFGALLSSEFLRFLNVLKIFSILPLVWAGAFIFGSLGIILGLIFPDEQKRSLLLSLISLPAIFCSTVFFRISLLPNWFACLVKINPLSYLACSFRHIIFPGGSPPIDFLIVGLFCLLFTSFALLLAKRKAFPL